MEFQNQIERIVYAPKWICYRKRTIECYSFTLLNIEIDDAKDQLTH